MEKGYFATVILLNIVIIWFILYASIGTFGEVISQYGIIYWALFYVPKFLPILLFCLYILLHDSQSAIIRRVSWASFAIGLTLFFFYLFLFILSSFPTFINMAPQNYYEWSWAAVITYTAAFTLTFLLTHRKLHSPFYSLTFSTLLLSAGGMFYELPIYANFTPNHYISSSYPLILGTEFFSLAFLFILLNMKHWKPDKYFFIFLSIFLIHGVLWHYNPNMIYDINPTLSWWFPRPIGLAVLISAIAGLPLIHAKGGEK